MKIIIVGGGEIGLTTANVLSTKEHDLVLIESDEKRAKQIANMIDALVIKGDGTDISILKDAGAEDADAIVAAAADDKTNLMICEIAKSLGIKRIVARVNKSENEELFTKLGIAGVVPIVSVAVTTIKNLLMAGQAERVIYELGRGEVQVVAITIPKGSHFVGRPADIKNAIIGVIYRNGELIIPKHGTTIHEEDVLVLTARTDHLRKITKEIYGRGRWK
jgi:trk system potassium uptake protein TrkA